MNVTEIIVALRSGGVLSTLVNLLIGRAKAKKERLTDHKETIDMLLTSYEELVKERTKLLRELSDREAAQNGSNHITLE